MMIAKNKQIINRVILLILGMLFLGYCLLTILPLLPGGMRYDLDGSWSSVVHMAFGDRLQFGQDLIYTYGPYGFLQVDLYFPQTYGYAVIFRALIAIATWAGLFRLFRHCLGRQDGAGFFFLPILGFFPIGLIWMDNFNFTVVTLPFLIYFYVSKRLSPALTITLIVAALASLIKFTYLLLSFVYIALITIDELGKLRRVPQVVLVYLASLLVWWLIAAQNVTDIPAYLINGLEIVQGFSVAMGIRGDFSELGLYVIGTGIFWLVVGAIEFKQRRWWGILPTLGLAALLLITFKGAFTRHDAHALQALFNITPSLLLVSALLWSDIRRISWRIVGSIKLAAILPWGISTLLILFMGAIILQHHLNYGYEGFALRALEHIQFRIPNLVKIPNGQANLQGLLAGAKETIKQENFLPPISGSTDLYPNEIASIFAYDLEYQPRTVFQSFSAYTEKLARLNAEHLTQPDAPDNILFDLKPIDGHLASFEDGFSWPEILTRYDVSNLEGRYLLLQRNPKPRQYKITPIKENLELSLGEWFNVPTDFPVWAKIHLKPNFLGKVATSILRLPRLYLEIETVDGIRTKYRTVNGVMEAGFLLSPVLTDRWDFLNFAGDGWQKKLARQQVAKIRIVEEGSSSRFYTPTYGLNLAQLEFSRQDLTQVVGWQEWQDSILPQPLAGTIQKIHLEDLNKAGWYAHAPAKMAIALPEKAISFQTNFGILEAGVANALKDKTGDGVEFRIIATQADGQTTVLFSRKLQPRLNQQDRGVQQIKLELKDVDSSQLILETLAGQDGQWDWSYWSDLTID